MQITGGCLLHLQQPVQDKGVLLWGRMFIKDIILHGNTFIKYSFFNAYFFALVGYAWGFGVLIIFIK